jgi:hypothetical protein
LEVAKFKLVFTELKTLEIMIEVEVEAASVEEAAELACDEYGRGCYDIRLEETVPETSSCETRVGWHDAEGIFHNILN